MKNKSIIIICSLLLILLAAGVGVISSKALKVKANAVVNPVYIPINVETTGILKDLYVTSQQNVEKGQLVAEVEIPAKVNTQAKALAKPDVSSAKAKLAAAEDAYKQSALMYKDGVISQEDYDKSLDNLTSAQKAYKNAAYKANSAAEEQTKAKNAVSVQKVYAPLDGVVNLNNLNKGDETNPHKPIILLATNTPKVTAYVNEKTAAKLKINQEVEIKVKIFKEKSFTGIIELVGNSAETVQGYKEPVYVVNIRFKDDVSTYGFVPAQPVSVIFKK